MTSNQWDPVRLCLKFAVIPVMAAMAAMAAVVLPSPAVAQQQVPSPDQAPFILSSFDADNDKKIQ